MHVNLESFVILWSLLTVAVLALIVWRKGVTWHYDNTLRLLDAGAVSQQATVTHKLDLIDKWGKILTGIAVISGLLIAAAYAYQSWVQAYLPM
jgi:hypothetical protein